MSSSFQQDCSESEKDAYLQSRGSASQCFSSVPPPRSASREVFYLREVRQVILDLLDTCDVAKFMRVRKDCMEDIAKILYRSIRFGRLQSPLSESRSRNALYLCSVREVRVSYNEIPHAFDQPLGMNHTAVGDPLRRKAFLERYSPALCQLLHTAIRVLCPGVRKISYGAAYYIPFGPHSWIIYPEPLLAPSPSDHDLEVVYDGRIDLFHTYEIDLRSTPNSETFVGPLCPGQNHIRQRFDLRFTPSLLQFNKNTAWLTHLRTDPCWADIWRSVNFAELPITMEDIIMLYRKQIARGHTDRLQQITAVRTVAFSVPELDHLAQLAGSSLTSLILTRGPFSHRTLLTFRDLTLLMTTIQNDLPSLKVLCIAMGGSEESEAICRDLLWPDCLGEYGTLTELSIITDSIPPTPFNAIRALLPICAPYASVMIYNDELGAGGAVSWAGERQKKFIRYLRNQAPHRRRHLSVIDFDQLFVDDLDSVRSLEFKPDGQPLINRSAFVRQARAKASECKRIIKAASRLVPDMGGLRARARLVLEISNRTTLRKSILPDIAEMEREAQGMMDDILSTQLALIATTSNVDPAQAYRALPRRLEILVTDIAEGCRAIREEAEE